MTLADITKKIVADASVKKDAIVNEAQNTAGSIDAETQRHIESLEDAYDANLSATIKENETRIKATAEQESRMKIEQTRAQALAHVANTVAQRITSLSEREYTTFLEKIASPISGTISGTLTCPKNRMEITKSTLTKKGHAITEVINAPFSAGFILSGKDAVYNFSIDALINRVSETYEVEIAQTLFQQK